MYLWGKPPRWSAKFHIFPEGQTRSLCGKWMYGGADQPVEGGAPLEAQRGDCVACVRAYNKAAVEGQTDPVSDIGANPRRIYGVDAKPGEGA